MSTTTQAASINTPSNSPVAMENSIAKKVTAVKGTPEPTDLYRVVVALEEKREGYPRQRNLSLPLDEASRIAKFLNLTLLDTNKDFPRMRAKMVPLRPSIGIDFLIRLAMKHKIEEKEEALSDHDVGYNAFADELIQYLIDMQVVQLSE